MSTLPPDQYAQNWCNLILREPQECISGTNFAKQELAKGTSPSDLANKCSNWGVSDIQPGVPDDAATTGFAYGCYLTTAFSGDKSNLCNVNFNDNNGNNISMPFVCANTCNNIFTTGSGANKCTTQVNDTLNMIVNGTKCPLNSGVRCFDLLNNSDCQTNETDRKLTCVPQAVGCTLGNIQSQMLNFAQKYEQKTGQPVLSCTDYTTGGGSGSGGGGTGTYDPNAPTPMFPEGNPYGPSGGGNGGGNGGGGSSNSAQGIGRSSDSGPRRHR